MEDKKFREGNAEVVALVRGAIEPLAVKRYNRSLFPHGPENLMIKWPRGYMAWYISYPEHYAEIFGSEAVANAHETCVEVALDGVIQLVIGPNGAWKRDRNEKGWIVGKSERAVAGLVESALNFAFEALARDLAERSLAEVAILLRSKSIGFGKFNKIADVAKEILNS